MRCSSDSPRSIISMLFALVSVVKRTQAPEIDC